MAWRSTKTYGHNLGLSCAFRQWRADSHCHFVHGYAMEIGFVFETDELDVRNWAVDFGSLKSLKGRLEDLLDHKTLVAEDDPQLEWFKEAEKRGILELRVLPSVGCERLSEYIYEMTELWLSDNGYSPRVRLVSVEVREHGANSAVFLKHETPVERHAREMGAGYFPKEWAPELIYMSELQYPNSSPIPADDMNFDNLSASERIEKRKKDDELSDAWYFGC